MIESMQRGALANVPLAVSAVVYGAVLGVLSGQQGVSWAEMMGMNIFLFAGSAQFVMVEHVVRLSAPFLQNENIPGCQLQWKKADDGTIIYRGWIADHLPGFSSHLWFASGRLIAGRNFIQQRARSPIP